MDVLFIILIFGVLIWLFVLRASAYPTSIPTRTRIFHALILFFASLDAWCGIRQLVWLLSHPHVGDWRSLAMTVGLFCWGIAGACLLVSAFGMMTRRKNAVTWFLLFWALTFLSGLFVTGMRFESIFGPASTIGTGAFWIGVFMLTFAFYLRRANGVIFED